MCNTKFNYLVKIKRIAKGLTQDTLADMCCMSKKKLSAIECGRLDAKEDDIELLLQALDFDLENYYNLENEIEVLINQAFQMILYSEQGLTNLDSIINQKICSNKIIQQSVLVSLYNLSKSVLSGNLKEANQYKNHIAKHIELLSDEYRAIYYDFCASYYMDTKEYSEAINSLDKALFYVKSNDMKGLILYHYGYCYTLMYQSFKAYNYYLQAINIFNDTHNFIKMLYAYGNLADINMKLNQRDEALSILNESLKICKNINGVNEEIKAVFLRNISWVYLFSSQYDLSIKYAKEAITINKKDREYFCIAFSYYKIHNYQEALIWTKQGIELISKKNKFYKLLILIERIIKDYVSSIEYLCNLYQELENDDKDIRILLLDMIVEYSDYFKNDKLKLQYCIKYRNLL